MRAGKLLRVRDILKQADFLVEVNANELIIYKQLQPALICLSQVRALVREPSI